jgi:hypothetical protein
MTREERSALSKKLFTEKLEKAYPAELDRNEAFAVFKKIQRLFDEAFQESKDAIFP